MRSRAELVTLANENFVSSLETFAAHCEGGASRRIGGVFAYVTGLPFSLFNGCVVVGDVASAAELDEALAWVEAQDVPRRLFVEAGLELELEEVAIAHELERESRPYPGMVLHPIPVPPVPVAGVVVARVDDTGPDEFRGVGVAGGLAPELAERMFPQSLFDDADVTGFVGRLNGRAVGYSLAITSENATGVYNVGTLRDARRRGVGTAVTWAAVAAGRAAGMDSAVLQPTEMALAMYRGMGFRKVVDYAVFRESPSPIGHETPVPPSPQ